MTDRDPFLVRVHAYAARLEPPVQRAFLRVVRELAAEYGEAEVLRLIERGDVEAVVKAVFATATPDQTLAPLRDALRSTLVSGGQYFLRDTPGGPARTAPLALVHFDYLHPTVVAAIRAFETVTFQRLADEWKAAVAQAVETGLQAGENPRVIARGLRTVIGLAANQEAAVVNFRRMLASGDATVFDRVLRDRRFDRTIRSAFARGGLSTGEIDRMAARYRERMLAFNAETHARTHTLNAVRASQRLAWDQAIRTAGIDPADVIEQWRTTLDGRERPTHHAMHGTIKRFDELWHVPGAGEERYPGEGEYGCRCVSLVRLRTAALAA